MTVSELWYKWGWLIVVPIATMIITIWAQFIELEELRAKPKCKPCKCLTMKEILFHLEKREMFVDMLQRANKSERPALVDSANYHNAILDSTGNRIEY